MRGNVVSIQFLRFAAATLVVISHTTWAIQDYFSSTLRSVFLNITDVAHFGGSGVHIFFVISGFIMVYTSFEKREGEFSTLQFLVRRFVRIYPIYIIYSLAYLLFYYLFATPKSLSIEQFFGSILLLPGYSSEIIGPGWTLSFEIYFYVCFSIAMSLGLTRGIIALTAFFFAAVILGLRLDTSQPAIHVFTNTLLIEFLFGAWIGYALVVSTRIGNVFGNALLALAIAGFLAGLGFGYHRLPSVVTWGIPSALLVAGLVFKEKNGHVPFLLKRLSFLGDSSYSLYLLHIVLIDAMLLLALTFNKLNKLPMVPARVSGMIVVCLAATALCVAIAQVLYKLIELKLIIALQKLFARKTIPRAVPSTKSN